MSLVQITSGAQIRAARALLSWRRCDLAKAANLHPNAVAYWERREEIPPSGENTPFACHHMARALRTSGIVFVSEPGPGVAIVRQRCP